MIKTEQERLGLGAPTSEQLRTGPVLSNQALLISGFRNAVSSPSEDIILFDGHVLIDVGDRLIEIPTSVFAELKCDCMVVVTDDPKEIVRRRTSDVGRKRPYREPAEIADQQERVVDAAQRIAKELGIPCDVIDRPESELLREVIASHTA